MSALIIAETLTLPKAVPEMDRHISSHIIQDDTRAITAQVFFQTLYQHCYGQGCLELRPLPSRRQVFLPWSKDDLEQTIASLTNENVFFGVATRKDASGGSLKNCQELPVLFVDIDFKDTSEDRARKLLRDFSTTTKYRDPKWERLALLLAPKGTAGTR